MRLAVVRKRTDPIEAAVHLGTVRAQRAKPRGAQAVATFIVDDAHGARHPAADSQRLYRYCQLVDATAPHPCDQLAAGSKKAAPLRPHFHPPRRGVFVELADP